MAIGCARHRAYIFDRGGMTRLANVDNLAKMTWRRIRDDTSDASIEVQYPTPECAAALRDIASGRHELVLYRDDERVWEGVIVRTAFHGSIVDVFAQDLTWWLKRTAMRQAYDNSSLNATTALTRIEGIIVTEMARKEMGGSMFPPVNLTPYLDVRHMPGDARTARKTLPYQSYVFDDMDSLAHRGGVDYTMIGRRLVLWDTHNGIGRTPTVTEKDFLGDVIVTEYGMDLTCESIVTDGEGKYGIAGGYDNFYGWVEQLNTAYDESEGANPPTVPEMTSQAVRNLNGNNPAPTVVRIPDNSTLNPEGALTIDMLVPGVWVPLRATLNGKDFYQMQKLDQVTVEDGPKGEQIKITLSPASLDDSSTDDTE